jgi:RNA polymerase sigma factor (sigma-70 family)
LAFDSSSPLLPSVPPDETLLLERLADGDVGAFTTLYKRYQPALLRLIAPFRDIEDPEEVIQDIFLKLWLKRESVTGLRSVEFYLYRMARNRLIDLRRSKRTRLARERAVFMEVVKDDTGALVDYKEFYERVLQMLERLPERQRRIYQLNVFLDWSLDEIAEELQLSKAVVIKQLYLANKSIRAQLRNPPGGEWPSGATLLVLGLLFSGIP